MTDREYAFWKCVNRVAVASQDVILVVSVAVIAFKVGYVLMTGDRFFR